MYRNPTYRLVKINNGQETIIIETEAACIERALDYFYLMVPESYGNKKYAIRIKPSNVRDIAVIWD
tara:strand:- start:822 stop:1019 length:198 start_codon:yes stop_codon:yes gene_type:complete